MILLYILSLLAVLILFVPSNIIPAVVKWPGCFLLIFFIVFLFNLAKKDTKYITKDTKKKIVDHGLFNPLLIYVSALLYIFAFTLISTQLKFYNVTDYIAQFPMILDVFSANIINNVLMGLILIIVSILIYFFRYLFKTVANDSTLKGRSFLYIGLTIIIVLIGFINIFSFSDFKLYEYLETGYNWIIFFAPILLILFIDFIAIIIRCSMRKKKARKQLEESNEENSVENSEEAEETVEETEEIAEETVEESIDESSIEEVEENIEVTSSKLSKRKQKIVAKVRKKTEKKLAKKEAKIDKKIQKIKDKLEK